MRRISELKSLYQKILPEEESDQKSQLAQAVSHKMQERKEPAKKKTSNNPKVKQSSIQIS